MLIGALVVVIVIVVGVVIWAFTSGTPQQCVSVPLPGPMGGSVERACGTAAREWCRSVSLQHDANAEAVQAQCRAAGLP